MAATSEAREGEASPCMPRRPEASHEDAAAGPPSPCWRRQAEYARCRSHRRGGTAYSAGEGQAVGARAGEEEQKHDEVLALTRRFLEHDSHVKFMLDKLEEAGCPFPKDRIVVAKCGRPISGYFNTDEKGLTICYDNYQGRPAVLRNTLVHELVHAYDACRGRDVDFLNCKHLACTEVRAARLSGDCAMSMEAQRSNLPLPGYEKACARRRAQLSLSMLPHCKLTAVAHVLGVLDECYQDTEPFARPP